MIYEATYLTPIYFVYLLDALPNIETPFLDDSIIWMLLVKSGKNINSSRESSTTFLDGDNPITRSASFPSEYSLQLLVECTDLITSFLEEVRINGEVKEIAINRFGRFVAEG